MVADVRRGQALRSVARQFKVSLCTVQYWVRRADGQRLDRVDWSTRPSGARCAANRSPQEVETIVLELRQELKASSDLGEWGAVAIRAALLERALWPVAEVPAVRTIHRILERHGRLDAQVRRRQPPPPAGWYLPEVANRQAELDQFDVVSGLVIQDGPEVEVLTGMSLHGGWAAAWPQLNVTARTARDCLLAHWQLWGLPRFVQFDNDTRFQGPHQHRDVVSSVMRVCLSLEVTPVFAPPRETGFQAAIESFNGRWQAKVWARFHYESLAALQEQSTRYVTACRKRGAQRLEAAPARRPFPSAWYPDLQTHPQGRIIFVRRTDEHGQAHLLGRSFGVDGQWAHRLVRAEVDLDQNRIRFYRLRRREPQHQPLLAEHSYELPKRRFKE